MRECFDVTTAELIEVSLPQIEVIELSQPQLEVIEIGIQGVAGKDGLNGSSEINLTALFNIGGLRFLIADQTYADQTDIGSYGRVIGASKGAVSIGGNLQIVNAGELNGFTGLTPNTAIYLGLNGLITQAVPTTGFIQQLGVAIASDTILINIGFPYLLS